MLHIGSLVGVMTSWGFLVGVFVWACRCSATPIAFRKTGARSMQDNADLSTSLQGTGWGASESEDDWLDGMVDADTCLQTLVNTAGTFEAATPSLKPDAGLEPFRGESARARPASRSPSADDNSERDSAVDPSEWSGTRVSSTVPRSPTDRSRSPLRPVAALASSSAAFPLIRVDLPAAAPLTHKPCVPTKSLIFPAGMRWWADPLWHIFLHILGEWRVPKVPMQHESLCSGGLSEVVGIVNFPVWINTISGCDPKPTCQRLCIANCSDHCGHFFSTMMDTADRSGICAFHGYRTCTIQDTSPLDCLSACTPCQAWSSSRDKSKKTSSRTSGVAQHPEWKTTFIDFFVTLDARAPRGGWNEQVPGFFHACSSPEMILILDGHSSPGELFLSKLHQRQYKTKVLKVRADVFGEPPRDRRELAV
jgi:hypothetical protein